MTTPRKTVRIAFQLLLVVGVVLLVVLLGRDRGPVLPGSPGRAEPERSPLAAGKRSSFRRAAEARQQSEPGAVKEKQTSEKPAASRIDSRARQLLLATIVTRLAAQQVRSSVDNGATVPASERPGTLPRQYIVEQAGEIKPLLRECYQMALDGNTDLQGTLKVRFTVVADKELGGLITDSQVVGGSATGNEGLVECIRETMYALRLKAPEHGGKVTVTYPFRFSRTASDREEGR